MKVKYILSLLFFLPVITQAEVLLFNGKGNYDNKENPLGVKVYRGSAAEKRQSEYNMIEKNQKSNTESRRLSGEYKLNNIPDINSYLYLSDDYTFYWSMKYEKTYLNTKGKWEYTNNTGEIILNTDPKPENIMFSYLKSEKVPQYLETRRLGTGDLAITVNYKSDNDVEVKGGIKGVVVECLGVYGNVKTITDDNGNADCKRAGYPIRKISLKVSDLKNDTYWLNPKFSGTHWVFEFDLLSAHSEYYFENEKFQISNNEIMWNGRTLGANQQWIYKK